MTLGHRSRTTKRESTDLIQAPLFTLSSYLPSYLAIDASTWCQFDKTLSPIHVGYMIYWTVWFIRSFSITFFNNFLLVFNWITVSLSPLPLPPLPPPLYYVFQSSDKCFPFLSIRSLCSLLRNITLRYLHFFSFIVLSSIICKYF